VGEAQATYPLSCRTARAQGPAPGVRCGHTAPRRSPRPHRMSRVSLALRRRVQRRAQGLCEYCRSNPELTGHEFTIDHILPESHGGASRFENLCWCCFWCNTYKQDDGEQVEVIS